MVVLHRAKIPMLSRTWILSRPKTDTAGHNHLVNGRSGQHLARPDPTLHGSGPSKYRNFCVKIPRLLRAIKETPAPLPPFRFEELGMPFAEAHNITGRFRRMMVFPPT